MAIVDMPVTPWPRLHPPAITAPIPMRKLPNNTVSTSLAGGIFLVACDVVARLIPSRSEIPLGIVTGLIGAPLFLLLLIRLRRERAYA